MPGKKKPVGRWKLVASHMPRLVHKPLGAEGFDITRSEVVRWMTSKPELLQLLFNTVVQSGAIRYNHAMQVWEGVSKEEDKA